VFDSALKFSHNPLENRPSSRESDFGAAQVNICTAQDSAGYHLAICHIQLALHIESRISDRVVVEPGDTEPSISEVAVPRDAMG
jgi:acetyl esterase/lipase